MLISVDLSAAQPLVTEATEAARHQMSIGSAML